MLQLASINQLHMHALYLNGEVLPENIFAQTDRDGQTETKRERLLFYCQDFRVSIFHTTSDDAIIKIIYVLHNIFQKEYVVNLML